MVSLITNILSVLTVLGQIGILLFAILFIYSRKKESRLYDRTWSFLRRHAVVFAFFLVLSGVLLSLYYSDIVKYVPCKLCWYQRIILFPQLLFIGIAMLKKDKSIFAYLLPLNVLGASVSAYHYSIQVLPNALPSCSVEGISCSASPFFVFGYITIPMMVLTTFLILIILCLAARDRH